MILLLAAVTALLIAIALLHLAWGLGVLWPAKDEAALTATVVGFKGRTRMPGLLPSVAVCIALLVVVALAFLQATIPSWLTFLPLVGAAAVFLLRGLAAWLPAWRKLTPQQPFARLDQTLYGPICLILAAGLALIAAGTLP